MDNNEGKTYIGLFVDKALYEKLKQQKIEEERSVSKIVERILRKEFGLLPKEKC